MTLMVDMDFIEFHDVAEMCMTPHEPNDQFEKHSLIIKGLVSHDSGFIDDEPQEIAKIEFLSLANYNQSEVYLFDTFDAESQLACDSFSYVDSQAIVDEAFCDGIPIILITSINIQIDFVGNEKAVIASLSKFFNKRFGQEYLSFGLARQFFNLNVEGEPLNKAEMMVALTDGEYTLIEPTEALPNVGRAIPVFKRQR